ncbi:MAG: ATP-binding protein, partial [Hungatella sp.]
MIRNEREIGFDVDAYTARLIGRENVSKLEGAILELVKNAYDADARTIFLYYSQIQNCIYIMDNGTG